jgi:two-component system response regulator FixJ
MSAANRVAKLEAPSRRLRAISRARVLNDDPAVLVSLRFLFQSAGFSARGYGSGASLLASPLTGSADCFVLDHKPRGPDGLDLARKLRQLGLRAPIVLTTGFRCAALEARAGALDQVFAAPRVDEAMIQHLTGLIPKGRLRKST